MKKIIIVVNNMEVGGVQKSLYNLLWGIHEHYDVTLCLFRAKGLYLKQIPPDVKIITCKGLFRYLGLSQRECTGIHALVRGGLVVMTRIFGRNIAMKLVLFGEKSLPESYDCAVAFLQNGNVKHFYGGVQDYVLHRIKAKKKVAFLHCDYGRCGSNHPANNRLLTKFDQIAACSDGCRQSFEKIMPQLADRCITVKNCHRVDEIRHLADMNSVEYSGDHLHVVMVSRLAHEKGIERAIAAAAHSIQEGIPVMLHIVGGGSMRRMLEQAAVEHNIAHHVCFYGEQSNPYRYMKNADLFLMTSYHEAAPMVIDEARCLGLPVLTVETTSSHEMVTTHGSGWVCENTQESLTKALKNVLSDRNALVVVRKRLMEKSMDNHEAMEQFAMLTEENYDH